ncbi:MAG: hypothetical protein NTY74_09145, partial [Ignavibacteriae bacterium]|nr:hypothetical protein [Ignavibacteriota bacterium]
DLVYKILVGVFLFILTWNFKVMWNRIDKQEKDTKEIKDNYLSRFEKVFQGIAELKTMLAVNHSQLTNNHEQLTKLIDSHNEAMKNGSCPASKKHNRE